MKILEIFEDSIDIILEKLNADDIMPELQRIGIKNAKKITANKIKVVVPQKERKNTVNLIMKKFSSIGAIQSPNHKFVNIDGATVEVKPEAAQAGRLDKEIGQRGTLDGQIKALLNGQPNIKLQVGNRLVTAAGAVPAPRGVKADVAIVDENNNPTAWVSLKDGTSARDFQGFGGVTDPSVANHPELQKFVADLKAKVGNQLPRGTAFGRAIQDSQLKNQIVFGKEFGGEPGHSNVDLVLQGTPKITQEKGGFVLTGNHTWANGVTPSGDYDPTIIASYREDRNNFGIKGARFIMYSAAGRNINHI
jgi:hypothetical protein